MKGIKMSDCKFYVNEEERRVVCVIPMKIGEYERTSNMVTNYINDNFRFPEIDLSYAMNTKLEEALDMPKSFRGVAICAPEDEWDEEVGKMIAFSKAKDKCYKSFFKRANIYVQTLDRRLGDIIESFNTFGIKLENKQQSLARAIDAKVNK